MKKTTKITDNILKEIESGKYKNCYLIYNRRSTDEPESQKNSLSYQKIENTRFAVREHIQIASLTIPGICLDGFISEKHSAFKEDKFMTIRDDGIVHYKIERPKFFKLMQFLNKGYFKGVVVLCWDRISRNKGDENIISKLMKKGVDFRFVLASYDNTSSGALHMDIDGMFAEHHSRVTSEKVKINIRNLKDKGICTYKAPVGYLNTGTMDHKPIDQERAPIIVQLFEKYATGEWSLEALAKWAKDAGFTMQERKRRRTFEEMQMEETDDGVLDLKPVTHFARANSIQNILRNPFYTGRIYNNDGKLIESKSHVPIISSQLFGIVQAQLIKKNTSIRYVNKIDYPFRGIARCHYCTKLYTPYLKKNILYLGHRTSECKNSVKNVRADTITDEIIKFLSKIVLSQVDIERLNEEAETQVKLLQINKKAHEGNTDRRKRKLKDDLDYLLENKLPLLKNNVYSHESMYKEETRLRNQILDLQLDELINDFCYQETIEDVVKLSELLNNLIPLAEKANMTERDTISRLVLSELFIEDNTLRFKCKNGFQALEKYFISYCALNCWLSELPSLSTDVKYGIELLALYNSNKYRPP